MALYLLRRMLTMLPVALLVSVLVFAMAELVPGDPAVTLAGDGATAERVAEIRGRLGLDLPVFERYRDWLAGALRGNLGTSFYSSETVQGAIVARLPATLSLTLGAVVAGIALGVPLGTIAARRRGQKADRAVMVLAAGGIASPNYLIGALLVLLFAFRLEMLPATSYVGLSDSPVDWLRHLLLPSIALGSSLAATVARQLRTSLSQVLQADYVRTARAKGLRQRTVLSKHAARNALSPVVTVVGTQVPFLIGGSVTVERVFGISGMGDLAVSAVFRGDLMVVQGVVLLTAVFVMMTNLIVDLVNAWLNPKVR